MLEKIIKILFLIGIGAVGLLLIITDMVVAIAEFKWWAFLVIPVGFIVFEIGFIAALIIADWLVYAIRNRTFRGFFEKIPSWKDELTETSPIEFCNACEKAYNPEESGGIVNGHPFCTKCLEGMGEDSARLELQNEQLKETMITLHNDLFDSCPTGNLTPEQFKFVENVKRWQGIISSVVDWRDMPK